MAEEKEYEIDLSKDETPFFNMRIKRDQLLAKTDWWCMSDQTPSKAQLDYRKALRDVPQNNPKPTMDYEKNELGGINWPTKPE